MGRMPWVPKPLRELARDFDYIDSLPSADRDWLLRFADEYYGAVPQGISTPEQLAESDRSRTRLKSDLFAAGLRASGDAPDVPGQSSEPDAVLDSPRARELLAKLRAVRPVFDPKDGRRRARFPSALAERRFWSLREQLQTLIEEES